MGSIAPDPLDADPADWSLRQHERHMRLAIEAAHRAAKLGGAAIGAVAVDLAGRPVSQGYSMVVPRCDPTAHAEMTAIRAAAATLGPFHLPDLVLYSTLEPCSMCLGACTWAALAGVVFGADRTVTSIDYYDQLSYCALERAKYTRRDGHGDPLFVLGGVLFEATAALLAD
jgi:guanine deaminase